jgi:hypothetical protein
METTTGKDINTSSIESAEMECRGNLTSVGKFDRSIIRKRIENPTTKTVAEFI